MNILNGALMQALSQFQKRCLKPVYAGATKIPILYNSMHCDDCCVGSCEGECDGSCKGYCHGSCEGDCLGWNSSNSCPD